MLPLSAIAPTFANAGFMPGVDRVAGGDASRTLQRMGIAAPGGGTFPIPELTGPLPSERSPGVAPGAAAGGSFGDLFGRMVQEVSAKQQHAAEAARGLQAGDPISLHQAVIAMEEASVSFQLMVEMRNKLLEAYQELMRMQI
jgi:flagellar hook-basal body complex protein FliE